MRVALVPTAVSNIWLVVLWTWQFEQGRPITQLPLWLALWVTALVALGLYSFGMVLNDLLDARRDRLFAAHRPLPSGRVTPQTATLVALTSLLAALACAALLGASSAFMCVICAGLIMFYNSAGKHLPALGLTTLGLIRVSHMLIANPSLQFMWLAWLIFSHVLLVSGIAYVMERKRPRLYPQEVVGLAFGWVIITLLFVSWMTRRDGLMPETQARVWFGPLVAGAGFALVAPLLARSGGDRRAGGQRLMRWGLLWLIVYDAAWLAAAKLWWQAGLVVSLFVLACVMVVWMRKIKHAHTEPPSTSEDPNP